ncbi:MAG: oligosaccharide flippase family protein [Cyanobacteria bacterium]|jgi:O-antigen/teichoic acid export membrane protein|nr:oligosaccharide flippase family protein [Cyanobacteria bacterium GSL.Bin1]
MPSTATKKLAIQGAAWTVFGYGFSQGLRLVSNLVLTRLLVPELFGLMALVNTFITGLNLFSDVGIGPSIIQNKRGEDPDFYNTAWTIQLIRGFGLWLCCFLIAWPVAQFYNDLRLIWLLPTVGLTTVIAGFNSTAIFTLNRRIALGKLTKFELKVQVLGMIVMIIWAAIHPSIWALIIGNFVTSILKMIWSHRLVPEKTNFLAWNQEAVNELIVFGKWIFVSTAMTFLASQTDRLLLGKLLSLEMLGIYTIAFLFADMPRQIIQKVSNKVIFPVVSQMTNLPRSSLRRKLLQERTLILIGFAIFLSILISFGDWLIIALYDERYAQGAWMLPILALGIWPRLLSVTINPVLFAIGNPRYIAFGNFFKFIYMIIGLPLGFSIIGVLGVVIVIALNDLPFYGVVTYGLWKENLSPLLQDIQASILLIGLLSLILFSRISLGYGIPINGILQNFSFQ